MAGLALVAMVNLASVVVVTPASIGVFEAIVVSVLLWLEIDGDQALVAAVGLHASMVLLFITWGLGCRLLGGRFGTPTGSRDGGPDPAKQGAVVRPSGPRGDSTRS